MTSMEGYMIQAMVVCAFIFVLFFWSWKLKAKYQRQAIDHVLGEFVTIEGTSYTKLLKVEGGLVEIEADEGKGIVGKAFPVTEPCTFLSDYPEGHWCPRFLKCKIKKVVLREFDLEPISNVYSRQFVPTPQLLYNLKRERVTEIGAKIAEQRGKETGFLPEKKKRFGGATLWLVLALVAVAVLAILYISQSGDVSQMKAALGIP